MVCAPAAWADVLYLGGTGQQGAPTKAGMAWLINDGIVTTTDPDDLVGVDYPADLWPLVGTLSLDKSVAAGTNTLDGLIPAADGPVTVVGVSQGAVVINYEKRRLTAESNPRTDIDFVTLGDPTNSDGGILAKLPPVHIPILDVTFTPAPVDTPYPTTEIVRECDGFADWPDRPFNALADLNALAGIVYLHPDYGGLDLTDPENAKIENGNTTHIVVKTDEFPVTQPLRQIGADDNIVDAIDKPLRRIIDRAYDGPRPGERAKSQSLNNISVESTAHRPSLNALRSTLKKAETKLRHLGESRTLQRIARKDHDPVSSDGAEADDHD
jgi:PE-PPE domain